MAKLAWISTDNHSPKRDRDFGLSQSGLGIRIKRSDLEFTAVREVLKVEGFAALPRRLDEERPDRPRPTVAPVADVREFSLLPRRFTTACGGMFLFVPDLVRLNVDAMAKSAGLPGSKMIPAGHALRASLALKLWSIERKSHVMALVADEGLGLLAGLNVFPKKSYLSEYSCRIDHAKTMRLLASWHARVAGEPIYGGELLPWLKPDRVLKITRFQVRQSECRPTSISFKDRPDLQFVGQLWHSKLNQITSPLQSRSLGLIKCYLNACNQYNWFLISSLDTRLSKRRSRRTASPTLSCSETIMPECSRFTLSHLTWSRA